MDNEVRQIVKDCEVHLTNSRSQAAETPPEKVEFADYQMQKMSSDLLHFGSDTWLILVDWYSNFSFAKKLGWTGGTQKVIHKLRKIFFQPGFCEQLRTEDGLEYRQSFQRLCKRAGIDVTHSSAYNSSGNARAEKKIQGVKNLLRKVKDAGEDWLEAYSEWRNAPTVEGPSPAQLFYGRHVQSGVLPTMHRAVDVTQMSEGRRDQEQDI